MLYFRTFSKDAVFNELLRSQRLTWSPGANYVNIAPRTLARRRNSTVKSTHICITYNSVLEQALCAHRLAGRTEEWHSDQWQIDLSGSISPCVEERAAFSPHPG
jgi:hypothetical protein